MFTIFFLEDKQYQLLQVEIYMMHSFFVLIFEFHAVPFDSRYQNYIEVFNEYNILCVGYFALALIFAIGEVPKSKMIGACIVFVVFICVVLNLILVCYFTVRSLKMKWKYWMKKRKITRIKKEFYKRHGQAGKKKIERMKLKM